MLDLNLEKLVLLGRIKNKKMMQTKEEGRKIQKTSVETTRSRDRGYRMIEAWSPSPESMDALLAKLAEIADRYKNFAGDLSPEQAKNAARRERQERWNQGREPWTP